MIKSFFLKRVKSKSLTNKISPRVICITLASLFVSACGTTSLLQSSKPEQDLWFCQPSSGDEWDCGDKVPANKKRVVTKVKNPQSLPKIEVPESEEPKEIESKEFKPITAKANESEKVSEQISGQKISTENLAPKDPVIKESEAQANQSVEDISSEDSSLQGSYVLQFGAFKQPVNPAYINELSGSKWLLTRVKGMQWYVLVVDGFADKASAERKAQELASSLTIQKPWVRSTRGLRKVLVK